jgi:SAM-dependent methyltransferase
MSPTPSDYDRDPRRYRRGMRLTDRYSGSDLYAAIAAILDGSGARRIADVGCAEGRLRAAVPGHIGVLGLDASQTMLRAHPPPAVAAAATALPLRTGTLDAVVTVNTYDHLGDARPALRDARRVLVPGGLFVAGAISRTDSPELAGFWRPVRSPFDAEDAPKLVDAVFGNVEVRRWDAPLVRLPNPAAVRDYLLTRFAAEDVAAAASASVDTPLWITKRGALVLARR